MSSEPGARLRDLPQATISTPPAPRARLDFPGSVTCEPDVSNLHVRARGHAVFMGDCSEAEITTELGSAFFLYGATAAMLVHAGLNIYVRHATRTTLAARQDIIVEKTVQQSVLTAGRAVIGEGAESRLAGGETAALRLVQVAALGNAAEVPTLVTVTDPGGSIVAATIHPNVTVRIGSVQLRLREVLRDGWQRLFLRHGELQVEAFPPVPGATARRLR